MEQAPQDAPPSSVPAPGRTFWFGAGIFWLFIFAEVFDDVRHGHENLFLLFGTAFWLGACAIALGAVHLLWHRFPQLSPRSESPQRMNLSVLLGLLCGPGAAFAWGKSPLLALCYDSGKWMLVLLIAGWTLGVVFKRGGTRNVVVSLLAAMLSAVVTVLVFFLFALMEAPRELWGATWSFAALGVPFTVAVMLYECTLKARSLAKEREA
ncbi:hypothetical protein EON80_24090, partial [bacterium]